MITTMKTLARMESSKCRITGYNQTHIWIGSVLIDIILVAVDVNLARSRTISDGRDGEDSPTLDWKAVAIALRTSS